MREKPCMSSQHQPCRQVPERVAVFYRAGLLQRGGLGAALAAALYGASTQPQLAGAAGLGEFCTLLKIVLALTQTVSRIPIRTEPDHDPDSD